MSDDFDKIPLGVKRFEDETVDSLSDRPARQWEQYSLTHSFDVVAAVAKTARSYAIPVSGKARQLLQTITDSIRASDEYKDALIFSTRNAVNSLTSQAEFIQDWKKWFQYSKDIQREILQELHNEIIKYSAIPLAKDPQKPLNLQAVEIHFYEAPSSEDPRRGYASRDAKTGTMAVYINMHDDHCGKNFGDAIETLAHETSHIIEFQIAKLFNPDPTKSPLREEFAHEAEAFQLMWGSRAYISGDISFDAYKEQINEHVAHMMGEVARDQLLSRLDTSGDSRAPGIGKLEA